MRDTIKSKITSNTIVFLFFPISRRGCNFERAPRQSRGRLARRRRSNRDTIDLPHPRAAARALAIDIRVPVKWMMMAATMVDTMLQSNGFQAKKKEDIENKDNLWYVPWSACRGAPQRRPYVYAPRERRRPSVEAASASP